MAAVRRGGAACTAVVGAVAARARGVKPLRALWELLETDAWLYDGCDDTNNNPSPSPSPYPNPYPNPIRYDKIRKQHEPLPEPLPEPEPEP